MKKAIKEKFITALTSGQYKKINSYLKTSEGYCANGVLCEIIDPSWNLRSYVGNRNQNIYKHKRNDCAFDVPNEVLDKAGISYTESGYIEQLNDKNETWEPVIEFIKRIRED